MYINFIKPNGIMQCELFTSLEEPITVRWVEQVDGFGLLSGWTVNCKSCVKCNIVQIKT